jgi:hypothetical protein
MKLESDPVRETSSKMNKRVSDGKRERPKHRD